MLENIDEPKEGCKEEWPQSLPPKCERPRKHLVSQATE